MKLAKLMTVVMLVIALVVSLCVAVSASAVVVTPDESEEGITAAETELTNDDQTTAKKITVTLSCNNVNVKEGDEIVVVVGVAGDANELGSGSLPLTFDSSLVEFVSSAKLNNKLDMHASAESAADLSGDYVNEAFAFMYNLGESSGNIYSATFRGKPGANGVAKFGIADDAYLTPNEAYGGVYDISYDTVSVGVGSVIIETTTNSIDINTLTTADPNGGNGNAPANNNAGGNGNAGGSGAYSPATGSSAALATVAAITVLAGAAFVASNKSKKN